MANRGIDNTIVHKNTFDGGLNADVKADLMKTNQYRDALNVTITEDGEFFAMKNIKGTTEVQTLFTNTDATTTITTDDQLVLLGAWAVNGYSGTTPSPAIVASVAWQDGASVWKYAIKLYRIETDTLYTLYEGSTSGDAVIAAALMGGTADAIVYAEAGLETMYYTDNVFGTLRIPMKYTVTPWIEEQVTLPRLDTNVTLSSTSVTSGGSLECGTYQFALRYCDRTLNRYTKWSILSDVIAVSNKVDTATEIKNANIGGGSGKKIVLQWTYNEPTATKYDHAEIAVIRNTDGTSSAATTASIVGPVSRTGMSIGGSTYEWEYSSNDAATPYNLSEVVIDDAAIKTFKTLSVKNNRLMGGGPTYEDLTFVTGSSTPKVDPTNCAIKYDLFAPTFGTPADNELNQKGYFRGEVYRFGVVFHDKYGNWSNVKPLDMSTVTSTYGNFGSGKDWKFPERTYGAGTWTDEGFLFDTPGNLRKMGLTLGITNIPDWATGMAIVRVPRIKKVLGQTPIIPSILVQPAKAYLAGSPDKYPISYTDESGTQNTDDTDATAPDPLGTIMPKNFFHNYAKSIIRDKEGNNTYVNDNEVSYTGATIEPGTMDGSIDHYQTMSINFIYPPEFMFTDGNTKYYTPTTGTNLGLELIDSALLKCKKTVHGNYASGAYNDGDYVNTTVHGSFYAINVNDYYNVKTQTATLAGIFGTDPFGKVKELTHVAYGVQNTLISSPRITGTGTNTEEKEITSSVMNYDALKLTGSQTDEGFVANTQECYFMVTENKFNDITKFSYDVNNTQVTNTVSFPGSSQIDYATRFNRHSNAFNSSDSVHSTSVAIANVVEKGVDDHRYGDLEQYHRYIFTGAYKELSGGTSTTIDVWGGDCYIGLYTIKLTDRTYSIPSAVRASAGGSESDAIVRAKWKRQYDTGWNGENDWLRPVGLDGVAQTISLWLESEVNPASVNFNTDTTGYTATTHPFPVPDPDAVTDIHVPYNYRANLSMSTGNILKIWIPEDLMERDLITAGSRIAYSDQKIYNSDIEGFDRFRVASFYDLDETHGAITKLVTVSDNLYAIQESAYAYVPIDASVIETADAANLAVRAGDIIGIPKYLNTSVGCQHQRTVDQGASFFMFFDYKNKLLVRSRNGEEEIVSDKGLIDLLNDIDNANQRGVKESDISGFYDNRNRTYLLHKRHIVDSGSGDVNGFAYLYDDKVGAWVSKWCSGGTNEASIYGGMQTKDGEIYLIGKILGASNVVQLSTMHTGSIGTFFGEAQPAYVKFIVNPEADIPKTFDSVIVNSDSEVDDMSIEVPLKDGVSYNSTISDFDEVESLYKAKLIRNTTSIGGKTGQRMRGLFAYYTLNFDQTQQTSLNSVLTRVRPSNRGI
jgi:hypothetical protein